MNKNVKIECTEKTMWGLMVEIERLKQENMKLKIERDEWKEGFKLLHNSIENQEQDKPDNTTFPNEYEEFLQNDAIMYCYNEAYAGMGY